jgi:AbiV family abortive infection protein
MSKIPVKIHKEYFKEGLKLSIKNAKELSESAVLLFDKEKYPQAGFLAYMGIEEMGKALFLLDDILAGTLQISKNRWKNYYCSHFEKIKRVREEIQKRVMTITDYEVTISLNGKIGDPVPEDEMIEDLTQFATDHKFESMYIDYGHKPGTIGWLSPYMYPETLEGNAKSALGFNANGEIALREAFYHELPEMLDYMNSLPDYFGIKKE